MSVQFCLYKTEHCSKTTLTAEYGCFVLLVGSRNLPVTTLEVTAH